MTPKKSKDPRQYQPIFKKFDLDSLKELPHHKTHFINVPGARVPQILSLSDLTPRTREAFETLKMNDPNKIRIRDFHSFYDRQVPGLIIIILFYEFSLV